MDSQFDALVALLEGHRPNPSTRAQLYEHLSAARKADEKEYEKRWLPRLESAASWWHVPLRPMADSAAVEQYLRLLPGKPAWSALAGAGSESPDNFLGFFDDYLDRCVGFCAERWSWHDTSFSHGSSVTVSAKHLRSFIVGGIAERQPLRNVPNLRQLEIALNRTAERPNGDTYDIAFEEYQMTAISDAPIIDQVRVLRISNGLSTATLKPLTTRPFWARLQELDLSHNNLPPTGLRSLFRQEMPELRCLTLRGNLKLNEKTVEDLLRKSRFPALEYLDLRDCSIPSEAPERLLRCDTMPRLESVLL